MVSKFKKHTFLTFIIIFIVTFSSGIIVGKNMSSSGLSNIEKLMQNSELNTESFLVEQDLINGLGEDNCGFAQARLYGMSHELGKIGSTLADDMAEETLGKNMFNLLKRKYHMMQIQTYLMYHKLRSECNLDMNVVLFFYDSGKDSKTQGEVLDKLVNDFDITVFAIEYNYSRELKFIEDFYSIEKNPYLVLNFDKEFSGLTSYDVIKDEI